MNKQTRHSPTFSVKYVNLYSLSGGQFALHIKSYKYVYLLTQGTLCKNLS